jgi:ABC-2 type transport system ATP-binding protein
LAGILVDGLERKFGSVTAVDHLSFEVDEGEVLGLLGPNGAGKTTTVRILACLISPTGGSASICGHGVTLEPSKVRQAIGVLTENPCLYERLTACENMEFFAEAYGISLREQGKERIRELLEFFNLWGRREDKVANFSKGMKQKLAIARALIHEPPVLLLDEPTAGLDPESAKEVRDMITELSSREKRAVLLSTHRLEDAEKLCNHVMIVNRGRCIAEGTPDSLRRKLAGVPILEVVLKAHNAEVAEAVRRLSCVGSLEVKGQRLLVTVDDLGSATPQIVDAVVRTNGLVLSVAPLKPSIEEIYLRLVRETGR